MAGVPRKAAAVSEYAWEKEYARTWETVKEGEDGRLAADESNEQRMRRDRLQDIVPSVRRGMIRYMFLVVDFSRAVMEPGFSQPRAKEILLNAVEFTRRYFDQNPLSQMGVIVTLNQTAHKLTDLSANPRRHIQELQALLADEGHALKPGGSMSMDVALTVAWQQLSLIPTYGNREVVFVYSGLNTCDPGDIFATITHLKTQKVRVSFVSVSAEVFIAKTISLETGGTFGVALHEPHFKQLLAAHTHPPPAIAKEGETEGARVQLVKMGFPDKDTSPGWCACHNKWCPSGYRCPRCGSKCCDVPGKCPVCELPLVSSPTLARSYHHLFPVVRFDEVAAGDRKHGADASCFGCLRPLADDSVLQLRCPRCRNLFCFACDVFIHDSLHNCPGC